MRTDRHKYIFYHGVWDTDELYDIVDDPEERRNLIGSPAHEELARELRGRLFAWLRESVGLTVQFREPTGFRADQRSRVD